MRKGYGRATSVGRKKPGVSEERLRVLALVIGSPIRNTMEGAAPLKRHRAFLCCEKDTGATRQRPLHHYPEAQYPAFRAQCSASLRSPPGSVRCFAGFSAVISGFAAWISASAPPATPRRLRSAPPNSAVSPFQVRECFFAMQVPEGSAREKTARTLAWAVF